MTEFTSDRRRFMSGVAATSMFGLAGHGAGDTIGPGPLAIVDEELFEQGSSTIRLTIDGITSPAQRTDSYIECFAWEWDMSVPENLSGPADIGALNVLKSVDQTTPQLMSSLATRKAHPKAVLSVFVGDPSGRAVETLRFTLTNVHIVSLVDEGKVAFGTHPESLAMVFENITVEHPESGYSFQWSVLTE